MQYSGWLALEATVPISRGCFAAKRLQMFDHEIKTASFEHMAPCETHDFSNLFAISGVVTMLGAVFAFGLGVDGTAHSFDGTVENQLGAFAAELNI